MSKIGVLTMIRKLTVWIASMTVALLAMDVVLAGAAHAQEAVGEWHGVLANALSEMRIGITITPKPDGGYQGALSSPDQMPGALPLDSVTMENDRLIFSSERIHGRFEAHWDRSQSAWVGVWTQGNSGPLILTKGRPEARQRPQTPKPPFPYRAEDVSFDSAPGVRLAGTLTIPSGKGPFPAVVLITGSGAQDRDETIMDHKPFLVLADALSRHGIAVLRDDDRGFGKSTGDFSKATTLDFAVDTQAALAYLRSRPEIDANRLGLIGHSEGGLIGPMVALKDRGVAFVVMMAGPGVAIRDLMVAQREAVARTAGVAPEAIARNEVIMDRVLKTLSNAADPAQGQADAAKIFTDNGMTAQAAAASVKQLASAWFAWFIAYDPQPTLTKLKVPVLALNGDKDVQVISKQSLPAIRAALKDNPDATVVELPGLNHLFQTAGTGAPLEYMRIEETIAPTALDLMVNWVVTHTLP